MVADSLKIQLMAWDPRVANTVNYFVYHYFNDNNYIIAHKLKQ